MFTNEYRAQKVIALSFVVILFCIYNHNRPATTLNYHECLLDPNKYDGSELIVKNEAIIGEIFEDKFEILQNNKKIMVRGATESLKSNEFVSLRATFHKEGYLTVKEIHVHRYRRLKIAISILPVMIVGWIFFRKYKFNSKKMVFTER